MKVERDKNPDAHIISIIDQRFYDHLAQKGGGGALALVIAMRVIKEAVENGRADNLLNQVGFV